MPTTTNGAFNTMEAQWQQRFGQLPPIRAKASLLRRILKEEEQRSLQEAFR
jgi:hypothetical protein